MTIIIDCHGHFTTAPKALEDWRNQQIAGIKDPSVIWSANCAFFVASYAYGYAVGRGEGAVATGGFSGVLRWLDFGSGQERGVRGEARERFFEQQKKQPGEKDD
jgi:hypothetical protein